MVRSGSKEREERGSHKMDSSDVCVILAAPCSKRVFLQETLGEALGGLRHIVNLWGAKTNSGIYVAG